MIRVSDLLRRTPAILAARWIQALGLVLLFTFPVLLGLLPAAAIHDFDIWWHLRVGDWIVQHGSVPRVDLFSSYGMGKPWIAYSWLFEVLISKLVQWFGLSGIIIYMAAMRAAIAVTMFDLLRRLGTGFWKMLGLAFVGLFAMSVNFGPRPHLFTILFFILELDILIAARKRQDWRLLLLLAPVFLVWANVHVQVIYGLFLLLLFAVEATLGHLLPRLRQAALNTLPADRLWLCLALCGIVTLINPYSLQLYSVVFGYMGQTGQWSYITELQAPSFRDSRNYWELFIVLAAFFSLGWRREYRPLSLVLLVSGALLAFRSSRDAWFLIVPALAILPPGWTRDDVPPCKLSVQQAVLVVSGLCISLALMARVFRLSDRHINAELNTEFPVAAVQYLKAHKLQGPIFNDYNWGGFLIYTLPEMPVSVDGRSNLHGDERIQRILATWNANPDWSLDDDLNTAHVVLASSNAPLTGLLRLNRSFRPIYEDHVAVIFQRESSTEATVVAPPMPASR